MAGLLAGARAVSAGGSCVTVLSHAIRGLSAAVALSKFGCVVSLITAGFVGVRSCACAIPDNISNEPNSIHVRVFMGLRLSPASPPDKSGNEKLCKAMRPTESDGYRGRKVRPT